MKARDEKVVRERNILLHNIPESNSSSPELRKRYDQDSFQNVVEALLGEGSTMEVENVIRLGRRQQDGNTMEDQKPRLMLIKLRDRRDVEELMKNRWSLKDRGFENIYLTRDLPPEEREARRKLRQELTEKGKETHMIFQGKVVPRQGRDSPGEQQNRQVNHRAS